MNARCTFILVKLPRRKKHVKMGGNLKKKMPKVVKLNVRQQSATQSHTEPSEAWGDGGNFL